MKVAAAKGHVYIPDYDDDYDYYDYEASLLDHTNYSYPFGDECGIIDDPHSPEARAIHYIELVGFPIILLQGLVGNLLAIPVLCKISRRAWSTVVYLALLGGTDLIILLPPTFWWLLIGRTSLLYGGDGDEEIYQAVRCQYMQYYNVTLDSLSSKIMSYSDAMCKTYNFAFTCIKHLTPWLLVASSLEMMVATRWPKRTYVMCTLQRARYVLMLMVIIIVCLDINYFWTYGVPKRRRHCVYTEDFSAHFRDWIWPMIDNTVDLALPLLVVSICFFMTATTMIRRPASRERDLELQMKSYFLEPGTLRDFRHICLILSLMFMCLATFKLTFNLIDMVIGREYLELDCSILDRIHPTMKLIGKLSIIFFYIFQSCKIYVYLALSSMFRDLLAQGFLCVGRTITSVCGSVKKLATGRRSGRGNINHQSQTRPLIHNKDEFRQSNSYRSKAEVPPGAASTSQDTIDLTDHQDCTTQNNSVNKTENGPSEMLDGRPTRNNRVDKHKEQDSQPVVRLGTKV